MTSLCPLSIATLSLNGASGAEGCKPPAAASPNRPALTVRVPNALPAKPTTPPPELTTLTALLAELKAAMEAEKDVTDGPLGPVHQTAESTARLCGRVEQALQVRERLPRPTAPVAGCSSPRPPLQPLRSGRATPLYPAYAASVTTQGSCLRLSARVHPPPPSPCMRHALWTCPQSPCVDATNP